MGWPWDVTGIETIRSHDIVSLSTISASVLGTTGFDQNDDKYAQT
jgi:hypothetical protein